LVTIVDSNLLGNLSFFPSMPLRASALGLHPSSLERANPLVVS
jgi:hypothetical protein